MQQVELTATSSFAKHWIAARENTWQVLKITDHVLFSSHPGPWMLLEQNHFQRWVNLSADQHFHVHWAGWQ